MRGILLAALVLLAVGSFPPAGAPHCSAPGTDTSANTIVVGPARFYVTSGVTHLYMESNSIAGLQRDDPQRDDTCHNAFPSDLRLVV